MCLPLSRSSFTRLDLALQTVPLRVMSSITSSKLELAELLPPGETIKKKRHSLDLMRSQTRLNLRLNIKKVRTIMQRI